MVNNVNNRKQNVAKAKLSQHKLAEGKAQMKTEAKVEWVKGKERGGQRFVCPEMCIQ